MLEWIKLTIRGLFWALVVLVSLPLLMVMRIDARIDYAEDLAFGYDDDDPGEDVDD